MNIDIIINYLLLIDCFNCLSKRSEIFLLNTVIIFPFNTLVISSL